MRANTAHAEVGPSSALRAKVDSPTVPGAQERVRRAFDTIEWLKSHKVLDAAQYAAAESLRAAYEVLAGARGSAGFEPRAAARPGAPPLPTYLVAAEQVHRAKLLLYPKDYQAARLVCQDGRTIEDAAAIIFGRAHATRAEKEEIGRRLRAGLSELSRIWAGQQGR